MVSEQEQEAYEHEWGSERPYTRADEQADIANAAYYDEIAQKGEPTQALQIVDQSFTLSIPENATIEQRIQIMSYMGDSEPIWNFPGASFTIIGAIAVDDWVTDENGNPKQDEEGAYIPCKRTIWRTNDGKLYHSKSNVLYGWCKAKLWPIVGVNGQQGNLIAPTTIRIGSRSTKNGRRTFKFDILQGE